MMVNKVVLILGLSVLLFLSGCAEEVEELIVVTNTTVTIETPAEEVIILNSENGRIISEEKQFIFEREYRERYGDTVLLLEKQGAGFYPNLSEVGIPDKFEFVFYPNERKKVGWAYVSIRGEPYVDEFHNVYGDTSKIVLNNGKVTFIKVGVHSSDGFFGTSHEAVLCFDVNSNWFIDIDVTQKYASDVEPTWIPICHDWSGEYYVSYCFLVDNTHKPIIEFALQHSNNLYDGYYSEEFLKEQETKIRLTAFDKVHFIGKSETVEEGYEIEEGFCNESFDDMFGSDVGGPNPDEIMKFRVADTDA